MSRIEKLGRVDHPELGRCVKVAFSTWDGGTQRHNRTEAVFPILQAGQTLHPRHPTGYSETTGERVACISPSCSFYSELLRYAGFRWDRANPGEPA